MNAEMGFMLQTESYSPKDMERIGEIQRSLWRKARNTMGVGEYGERCEQKEIAKE